ncbi:MAG TPA: hypothetical protein VGC69_00410 [Bordetella sp.]
MLRLRRPKLAGDALGAAAFSWQAYKAPMLAPDQWVPDAPVPLARLDASLAWNAARQKAPRLHDGFAQRMREELKAKLEDNTIYRLFEARATDGVPAFTCGLATYFDHIDSGEALVWEAAQARVKAGKKAGQAELLKAMLPHMPLRQKTGPLDFSTRTCCIGVDTLTVVGFRNRPAVFFMHERGSGQRGPAEAGNSLHVVPAGSFQPNAAKDLHHDAEYSVRRNVLRECAEELFDKEDLMQASQRLSPDRIFEKDPELHVLKGMFDDGGITQWYLGSFIDPLTLKVEVLTLLLVDGDRLADSFEALRDGWEGHHDQYPFTVEELDDVQAQPRLLPAGQAALILGIRHYGWIQQKLAAQLAAQAPATVA